MEANHSASLALWGTATAAGNGEMRFWDSASFTYPSLNPVMCGLSTGLWTLFGQVKFQTSNAGLMNELSGTVTVFNAPPPPPVTTAPTATPTTFLPTTRPTTSVPTGQPTTGAPTGAPTDTTLLPTTSPATVPPSSAPTAQPTTLTPTASPTSASPTTSAPSDAPTPAPPCPPPPPTFALIGVTLEFTPGTVDEFNATVEAEATSLLTTSAGVSTSQMTIGSVTETSGRRLRHLLQTSVQMQFTLEWNVFDVIAEASGGQPAADPDAFVTLLQGNPGDIFISAVSPILRGDVSAPLVMSSGGITVATSSFSPPPPPNPPPPPACEVYDPCFSWGDVQATCVNVAISENSTAGWLCLDCPLGFDGNGTHCDDVDECGVENGGCHERTTCANVYGARTCGPCPNGFSGNGAPETGGCVDTDECATNNGGCDFLVECVNTPGSFSCGQCPSGFSGTGYTGCADINECLSASACDPLTICTNTAGDFECSACPPGYFGSGKTACAYASSCDVAPCDPLTQCTVVASRVQCSDCPPGYSGAGFIGCTEINGCAATEDAPNGPCFPGVECTDVAAPGLGFVCGPCPQGYIGEYGVGELGCKLDLCALGDACSLDPPVPCSVVTSSDVSCGVCPPGYSGDGYVRGSFPGCEDIDECAENNPCDPLVACTNLRGAVQCGACPSGFVGTGLTGCQLVTGSCADNNGGCWTNGEVSAACADTDPDTGMQLGTPVCGACPAGFEDSPGAGLGTSCRDIDGCAVGDGEPAHCAEGILCLDVAAPGEGSTCAECPMGSIGDGYNPDRYLEREGCYPDMCFSNNGGCSSNPAVACTNDRDALNGRVCGPGCPTGYTDTNGDATKCEDEKGCELFPCFSSVSVDPAVAVKCTDLPPPASGREGRVCGDCPSGFTGDGATCQDIDECADDSGGCFADYSAEPAPVVTTCTNTLKDRHAPKGRLCGPCPEGYKGSGDTECIYVERCGVGDSTETNGGCWVGRGLYAGLTTTCTDLPNLGGTECGPCPAGMSSADGTGATGCEEVDACIQTPCYNDVTCTDYRAYEEPPVGRKCTYVAYDPTLGGDALLDWTCPEGYKGDGADCVECTMLVRITNATVVGDSSDRAGWNLQKTVQVMGQLTGLDSPECTNLQGTYFRWVASVSDASPLVLDATNKASTRTLTVFKSQLKVKRSYIISFEGILRGNAAIKGAASIAFYVKSLPIAIAMAGGNVVTGDRAPVLVNASATTDPDGAAGEIQYSWRCRVENSNEKCRERSGTDPAGKLLPTGIKGPVLNVSMLGGSSPNPINYTFTLTATKAERTTTQSTKLTIFKGGAPVPSIAALVCSQPPCKANPVAKFTLRASVYSDDPGYLTTEWSVASEREEDAFEISAETCLTSKYNKDLVVKPGVLKQNAVYTFSLVAEDRIGPSSAELTVAVNSPPRGGSLGVSPQEGVELETSFRLTAIAWADEDKPLRYQVHYKVPGEAGVPAGEGAYKALSSDYTPNYEQITLLPQAGLDKHGNLVTLRLSVIDNYDAVGTYELNVTVRAQAMLVTDDLLKTAMTSSLNGDTDSVLTLVLGTSKALADHIAYDSDALDSDSAADDAISSDEIDYDYEYDFSKNIEMITPSPPPPNEPPIRRRRVLLSAGAGNSTNTTSGSAQGANSTGQKVAQVALMVDLMGGVLEDSFRTADAGASMSGTLESVLADPMQIAEDTQESALGMYDTLSKGTPVSGSMADSVCSGLNSLNVAKEPSVARRRRRHLLQAAADGLEEGGEQEEQELVATAARRGAQVVQVLSDLGGTMIGDAVADEDPVSTHSGTLAMKVGRTRSDLPSSTLYAAPVDTGDGSSNQVKFPSSMGPEISAAAASLRRRRQLLQQPLLPDSDSDSYASEEDTEVLPEQEVSMRVLTTASEMHTSNASAPGYTAEGVDSAGAVQQVVLGADGDELVIEGLEEAIEVTMELTKVQVASRRRRLLAAEPIGRLECRFWSDSKDSYDTEGCVTLPNPAPAGAQLRWRTRNMSAIPDMAMAWEVGNTTMTAGCEEHFDAVLDPAVWAGQDAGYRKWAAVGSKPGVYVDYAGCELIENSSFPGGCHWQWTSGMFVGTDCVTAPVLDCLCTHLTDFKALENKEVGSAEPPEIDVPTDDLLNVSAADVLKSVVLLAIVFAVMGSAAAAAVSSHQQNFTTRQRILTGLITQSGSGIYGFKNFGGTWTWSIFDEDRIKGIKRMSDRLQRMQRNKLAEKNDRKLELRQEQLVMDLAHGRLTHAERTKQLVIFTQAQQARIMHHTLAAKMLLDMGLTNPLEKLHEARKLQDPQAIAQAEMMLQEKWARRWKKRVQQTQLANDIALQRTERQEQRATLGMLTKYERQDVLKRVVAAKTVLKMQSILCNPLQQLRLARDLGNAAGARKAQGLLAQEAIARWKRYAGVGGLAKPDSTSPSARQPARAASESSPAVALETHIEISPSPRSTPPGGDSHRRTSSRTPSGASSKRPSRVAGSPLSGATKKLAQKPSQGARETEVREVGARIPKLVAQGWAADPSPLATESARSLGERSLPAKTFSRQLSQAEAVSESRVRLRDRAASDASDGEGLRAKHRRLAAERAAAMEQQARADSPTLEGSPSAPTTASTEMTALERYRQKQARSSREPAAGEEDEGDTPTAPLGSPPHRPGGGVALEALRPGSSSEPTLARSDSTDQLVEQVVDEEMIQRDLAEAELQRPVEELEEQAFPGSAEHRMRLLAEDGESTLLLSRGTDDGGLMTRDAQAAAQQMGQRLQEQVRAGGVPAVSAGAAESAGDAQMELSGATAGSAARALAGNLGGRGGTPEKARPIRRVEWSSAEPAVLEGPPSDTSSTQQLASRPGSGQSVASRAQSLALYGEIAERDQGIAQLMSLLGRSSEWQATVDQSRPTSVQPREILWTDDENSEVDETEHFQQGSIGPDEAPCLDRVSPAPLAAVGIMQSDPRPEKSGRVSQNRAVSDAEQVLRSILQQPPEEVSPQDQGLATEPRNSRCGVQTLETSAGFLPPRRRNRHMREVCTPPDVPGAFHGAAEEGEDYDDEWGSDDEAREWNANLGTDSDVDVELQPERAGEPEETKRSVKRSSSKVGVNAMAVARSMHPSKKDLQTEELALSTLKTEDEEAQLSLEKHAMHHYERYRLRKGDNRRDDRSIRLASDYAERMDVVSRWVLLRYIKKKATTKRDRMNPMLKRIKRISTMIMPLRWNRAEEDHISDVVGETFQDMGKVKKTKRMMCVKILCYARFVRLLEEFQDLHASKNLCELIGQNMTNLSIALPMEALRDMAFYLKAGVTRGTPAIWSKSLKKLKEQKLLTSKEKLEKVRGAVSLLLLLLLRPHTCISLSFYLSRA
ncbi:hypothetical protein CYMTET_49522 [Cymbomonas tetramitiformis]|uniref:Uncharacterized protein n=1 Tax=Cymbomonas tetramitiformis TaxID=36881 RepID=A0AAE0BQ10_9CHLO|nr:hypothetical protein CYMTET_49522 [Cymbomonas tetramitiformis]